jgi:EAL domain-containing protein (putative c-di-GMP-specific phosphodiesterase class I)
MSATPLLRHPQRLGLAPARPPCAIPTTMAFQPIVDAGSREVFAYEALVRGAAGEGAGVVLAAVETADRHRFDEQCRSQALDLAVRLGLKDSRAALSINFIPNAAPDPDACTAAAREAAERLGFPPERVIFEFTEGEPVDDVARLGRIIRGYRNHGFRTAIDDFGAGYSGLTLLARFQPDIVKLDMELIRGIDTDRVRRSIVASIRRMCDDLGIVMVAEGIETLSEYATLRDLGVSLLQGYLFARPAVEALPEPHWPRKL